MALLICTGLAGCRTPESLPTRFEFSEIVMGVKARVVLYADTENEAVSAARDAFDRMKQLDDIMTDWRDTSELMDLCRQPAKSSVAVSPELFDVLAEAEAMSRRTDGAFDITVGPIVKVWREARRTGTPPNATRLAEAHARTGWRQLRLDHTSRSATLMRAGMQLDLGGIGKGYAADLAAIRLEHAGVDHALIDLGGDIRTLGAPPGRDSWTVTVETGHADDPPLTLRLRDAAVATSGDTARFMEIDGVRYSHIIDPRSGEPLTTRAAVTVIAPNGTRADALASAISVLAVDGIALAESLPAVEAAVTLVEDGRRTRHATTGFEPRRVHVGEPPSLAFPEAR